MSVEGLVRLSAMLLETLAVFIVLSSLAMVLALEEMSTKSSYKLENHLL